MPEHTFDELPLLKYDGYEYSDVEPEPDRTVEVTITNFAQSHFFF